MRQDKGHEVAKRQDVSLQDTVYGEVLMKVVLFCGGQGMRMRDYSGELPKPMIDIGNRPILWHIMKYYSHFGHKDFILCLGYKGDCIKSFFKNYDECQSNDFVLSKGGRKLHLYNSDIQDWSITFADTGIQSNIGQRLMAAKKYLGDDEIFLANYADGLTDLPLQEFLDFFSKKDKVGCFVSVRPNLNYHFITTTPEALVTTIKNVRVSEHRINGGYFAFKKEIFDYIHDGEELVLEPFQRLVREGQLVAYTYDGFWKAMDTFADKREFDRLVSTGTKPWQLWNSS